MSDLSAADIAEGHRLDKAATPAPWDTDPHAHLEKGCRCLCCHDSATVTHTTNMLYCEDIPVPDGADQTRCDQPGYTWSDAELIVWARNHLPALLDSAEKLERVQAVLNAAETETPDDWGVTYVYTSRLREAIEGTRNDSGE